MYNSLFTLIKKLKKLLNITSNLIISSPRNCDHIHSINDTVNNYENYI